MIRVVSLGHSLHYELYNIAMLFFPRDGFALAGFGDAGMGAAGTGPMGPRAAMARLAEASAKDGVTYAISYDDAEGRMRGAAIARGGELGHESRAPYGGGARPFFADEAGKAAKDVYRCLYLTLSSYTGKAQPWGMLTGVRPAKIASSLMAGGLGREGTVGFLSGYYGVGKARAELAADVAAVGAEVRGRFGPDDVCLYVNVPFCRTRCAYCSFSSPWSLRRGMAGPYLSTLREEAGYMSSLARGRGLKVRCVYIGGGTPSSIGRDGLLRLFEAVEAFDLGGVSEYTLEAGRPDSIDAGCVRAAIGHGVNRVCVNPQTMNDLTLSRIGRAHTAEDVVRAVATVRDAGGLCLNMDVIAGLPGEGMDDFAYTMGRVESLRPENLTVHSLSVKRGSPMGEGVRSQHGKDPAPMGREPPTLSMTPIPPMTPMPPSAPSEPAACVGPAGGGGLVSRMVGLSMERARMMGMEPYYLYRQKSIADNLENTGYSIKGRECAYNVLMMGESHTVIGIGAGAMTKAVSGSGVISRRSNTKDLGEYVGGAWRLKGKGPPFGDA